jgi:uncharacterized protein YbjQ (UPF0145 family)
MSTPSTPYRSPDPPVPGPIVVTTGTEVPGHRVARIIGIVHGVVFHGTGMTEASMRQKFLDARRESIAALVEDARQAGAQAVIGVRFDSSDGRVSTYGTAVRLEPV